MKDVKDMTHAEKNALVAELMPHFVEQLMKTDSVITNDGQKATTLSVRFLNSHQISTESRGALDASLKETEDATTILGLRAAVYDALAIIKNIAVGNE